MFPDPVKLALFESERLWPESTPDVIISLGTANNEELGHWNLFCLDEIAGGFAFRIPAYLIWIEVFLVQPSLTRRLVEESSCILTL